MLLWVEVCFDAAHRLAFHNGKCRNMHGHLYKMQVAFSSTKLPDDWSNGMVFDFADIKALVKEEAEAWDHAVILDGADVMRGTLPEDMKKVIMNGPPTAENMVTVLGEHLEEAVQLKEFPVRLRRVRLYETPTSWIEEDF